MTHVAFVRRACIRNHSSDGLPSALVIDSSADVLDGHHSAAVCVMAVLRRHGDEEFGILW
jgi:hypothetical protein